VTGASPKREGDLWYPRPLRGREKLYRLLLHIAVEGPANKYQLQKATGLPKATLLRYIDQLKEEGYVEEVKGRRRGAKIVRCTRKGLAFIMKNLYVFFPSLLEYRPDGTAIPRKELFEVAEKIVKNYPNEAPLFFKWIASQRHVLEGDPELFATGLLASAMVRRAPLFEVYLPIDNTLVSLRSEKNPVIFDIAFIQDLLENPSLILFRTPLEDEDRRTIARLLLQIFILENRRRDLFYKVFMKFLEGEDISRQVEGLVREDAILTLEKARIAYQLASYCGLKSQHYFLPTLIRALIDSGLVCEYEEELKECLRKCYIAFIGRGKVDEEQVNKLLREVLPKVFKKLEEKFSARKPHT